MLLPILALAMMQSPCPFYVGVSNDGNVFFDRFQGWSRINATVLGNVLRQGCRTNFSAAPKPVTSVLFVVAPKAPQVEGPPKTLASRRPLPLSPELAASLENWKKQTSFSGSQDWVFASPLALGKKPYWPDAVLKRHIFPAAARAGIRKRIGWHSFRRTLATLLQSSGASVKTTQELMRHSSPVMTLGTYAKAVTADKRHAQDAIAVLFVGKGDTASSAQS
jgi:hypothetical protein